MQASTNEYQLLDFGEGRKLERFGPYTLDRPAPTAESVARTTPEIWPQADARFEQHNHRTAEHEQRGQWVGNNIPARWTITCPGFRLELKPTPFGHLGVFPEQFENWGWLGEQVRRCGDSPRVLNLFAYTGAATLAAASAGAQVVHVDAARNTVDWARRNAEISGLAEAPIRWIVEDALRFVRRECKRGNAYDAVILDPPSFGRGPKRETWKLERDLPDLLQRCGELTRGAARFVLLSCHTPGYEEPQLRAALADCCPGAGHERIEAGPMSLIDARGRALVCGHSAQLAAVRSGV